jgi:pyruvate-formate lyase-activating enzyme
MLTYQEWLNSSLGTSEIYNKSLNVEKFSLYKFIEGPGLRNAIFLQGCPNFCPGCRNLKAKPLLKNKLLVPGEVAGFLSRFQQGRFPSQGLSPKETHKKFLLLSAIRQIVWNIVNNPLILTEIPNLSISEYFGLAQALMLQLMRITRGYAPDEAPKEWTVLAVNGLTISGGEALLQCRPLKEFILEVKRLMPHWDICLYTGLYSLKDILTRPELKSVVAMTDMLKIGPFIWEKVDVTNLYYGSANQLMLDSRKTLAKGEPVEFDYPEEIRTALNISSRYKNEPLVPHLTGKCINTMQNLQLGALQINTLQEFESVFGEINERLVTSLFDFVPESSKIKIFSFLKEHELNISEIIATPATTTEWASIDIHLQGSQKTPAVDAQASNCHIRPNKIIKEEKLFNQLNNKINWYLHTERKGSSFESLRLNLALQERFLKVYTSYFLLKSPYTRIPLNKYIRAIRLYREQIRLFFNMTGQGSPVACSSIFIRSGDPLLQARTVDAFCSRAKTAGYEVWIEFPHSPDKINRLLEDNNLFRDADFIVCGSQWYRKPPALLPFKSSETQVIISINSNEIWYPRFEWSQQINSYVKNFQEIKAIADFRLPASIGAYFEHNLPKTMSVENFEAKVGTIEMDWEQSPA